MTRHSPARALGAAALALLCSLPVAAQTGEAGDPGAWTGPRYGPARATAPDARRDALSTFSETRAECRQGAARDERRECMREAVRQSDTSLRRLPAPREEGRLELPRPAIAAP